MSSSENENTPIGAAPKSAVGEAGQELPQHARVVIVGGGIIGSSVAYHLAKLGWSLVRDGGGCWVTDDISWHDFRDSYRPGLGQEEWPRICG